MFPNASRNGVQHNTDPRRRYSTPRSRRVACPAAAPLAPAFPSLSIRADLPGLTSATRCVAASLPAAPYRVG
jgi:hypothetical protein